MANAAALAEALAKQGFRLVSGGTDNHLLLVDLRTFDADLTGKVAQNVLDEAGITLNKNTVPDDPRSPFVTSGVRIGTPAVTTQGMTEAEMPIDRRPHRPGAAPPATTPRRWRRSARKSPRSAAASRPTPEPPGRRRLIGSARSHELPAAPAPAATPRRRHPRRPPAVAPRRPVTTGSCRATSGCRPATWCRPVGPVGR